MGTKRRLPGVEALGQSYDVNGYYADARSVEFRVPLFIFQYSSFDPDTNPDSKQIEVGNTDFYFPSTINAEVLGDSEVSTGVTFSATDREVQLNLSGEVEGWYEGFKGSVTASFDEVYRTSASFYLLTQMGIDRAYKMSIPDPALLRESYLTAEASKDINDPAVSPATLVGKYGAYFLFGGIWGGTLNYSQSISVYSTEDETRASATISANYMNFISSTMKTQAQVDNIASTTQSNGHFATKGGNPKLLSGGWEPWASDLAATGTYALVDFDRQSLMPISVLANQKSRQDEIFGYLRSLSLGPVPFLGSFQRNAATAVASVTNGSSSTTAQVTLMNPGASNVIVGIGASATKDKVTRIAFKVLDLQTNDLSWITSDGSVYNASNYQRVVDLTTSEGTRAVAVTGCGFTVTSGKVSNLVVYYQNLLPADSSTKPSFLDGTIHYVHSGDSSHQSNKTEVSFQPGANNRAILTGLALHVKDDNFNYMKIWQENLMASKVPANVAAQQEVKYKT